MLRRIAAAVAGLAVMLPATVSPARADEEEPSGSYYELTGSLLKSLLAKSEGGFSPEEIADLTLEAISAINGVKTNLLGRVDALAVSDIKADAQYAVNNTQFLQHPPYDSLYTQHLAQAVGRADTKLDVFTADGSLDTIGKALITEYTGFLDGEVKTGLAPSYAAYKAALSHIITTTLIHCDESIEAKVGVITYTCTFNGKTEGGYQRATFDGSWEHSYDDATWLPDALPRAVIEDSVMEGTSVDLAKQALKQLEEAGH
jgi:hypothetical protein